MIWGYPYFWKHPDSDLVVEQKEKSNDSGRFIGLKTQERLVSNGRKNVETNSRDEFV